MSTFNGAEFLGEQLNSIAAQTRLPDNVYVRDDGSTDDTLAVLETFAAHSPFPLFIHRNECHMGYSDSFLAGALESDADFIAFSDQDDVWHPDKLLRCEQLLTSENRPSLVSHAARVVNRDLKDLGRKNPDLRRARYYAPSDCRPFTFNLGFSLCFSRTLLDILPNNARPRNDMYDGAMVHDQWVFYLASMVKGVEETPEVLACYRQHDSNVFGAGEVASSRERLSGRMQAPDSEHYRLLSELAEERAKLADMVDRKVAPAAASWAALHRSYASSYLNRSRISLNRSKIYRRDISTFERCKSLIGGFRAGDYRSRSDGGSGYRSFLKDSTMCAATFFRKGS
jgi:glycosyltransferase involved in cell wall biosynthesis